jgi:hypothetical protein
MFRLQFQTGNNPTGCHIPEVCIHHRHDHENCKSYMVLFLLGLVLYSEDGGSAFLWSFSGLSQTTQIILFVVWNSKNCNWEQSKVVSKAKDGFQLQLSNCEELRGRSNTIKLF